MGASLNYPSVIQHHYSVRILNGRQSMGYYKYSPALHQSIHASLYNSLCSCIYGACRLIQYHYRRIRNSSPCYSQKLSLPLAEVGTVAGEHGIISFRQASDKVVSSCQLGSVYALFIAGVQLTVTYVLHYCTCKQVGILQYYAETVAQIVFFNIIYIYSVVTYFTISHIIETVDKVGNGCLAGACGADKSQLLSRLCIQRNIVEHGLFRGITKVDIIKTHITAQTRIRGRPLVVTLLPCPYMSTLLTLA